MKSKIDKYLKYVAAAVFVATLAINTVVTLDDPFVYMSNEAIATGTADTTSSGGTGNETGGTLVRNFKSATLYYNKSVSASMAVSEKPFFTFGGEWVSITCCVEGTDIDGCDFSLENPECKRKAKRPPH